MLRYIDKLEGIKNCAVAIYVIIIRRYLVCELPNIHATFSLVKNEERSIV